MKAHNLVGMTFGRLRVIERAPRAVKNSYWRCRCICGADTVVMGGDLVRGVTTSCGCRRRDVPVRHGRTGTPEYSSWQNMLARCRRPTHPEYASYGGRGIMVCDRWHTFENFLADMGERPAPDLSIERLNNDGNYEPNNCVWATAVQQARNRRVRNDNTSGVTGVSWAKREQRWLAKIYDVTLGYFDNFEDAVASRRQAERDHWGTRDQDQAARQT